MPNQTQTQMPAKSSRKQPAVALATGQGHRNSDEEMKKLHIHKLVKENPRRDGSWGFKSFALIKEGMSVASYVEKGGRMKDLRWDIAHGFVEVK